MVVTYDVEAKRTEKFKKLLRRFLTHTQFSVFTGDITEAKAIELRRELSLLMVPDDRVTEITAANRRNVAVHQLIKSRCGKGELRRVHCEAHVSDFSIL